MLISLAEMDLQVGYARKLRQLKLPFEKSINITGSRLTDIHRPVSVLLCSLVVSQGLDRHSG